MRVSPRRPQARARARSDLVLDVEVRLDLLHVLLLLDEALSVESLIIADLAQLLDAQLLPVGSLRVKLLVVPEQAAARPARA